MADLRTLVFRGSLEILHGARLHKLMAPYSQGEGVVFMLHGVRPAQSRNFHPNGILEITPEFLDAALERVRVLGLDIVTMDEALWRLDHPGEKPRFAVFTFDDGYRDNLEHALPVMERHDAPMLVYVPSDFPEGRGELWWYALEEVIAGHDRLSFDLGEGPVEIDTATDEAKGTAWETIYARLRTMPEDDQRAAVRALCETVGFDMDGLCRAEIMDWDTLKVFAAHPLVTIGAHTISHRAVGKLERDKAYEELATGADRLAEKLGERPRHFSFPYGDACSAGPRDFQLAREAGFDSAVTTRKGVLFAEHAEHRHALPRVSLNGDYQDLRYVDLYVSGAPFSLYNRFRKLNVA